MAEYTSRGDYDRFIATLDWQNFVVDRDEAVGGLLSKFYFGPETVALSEFTLPWGVGALLKNKIISSIESKAKEQGATVTHVRFWSNTAGILEDHYRVEVVAHDSPIAPIAIIGIIVGALALLGLVASLVLIAAATYKGGTGFIWGIAVIGLVVVAVIFLTSKRGRRVLT